MTSVFRAIEEKSRHYRHPNYLFTDAQPPSHNCVKTAWQQPLPRHRALLMPRGSTATIDLELGYFLSMG